MDTELCRNLQMAFSEAEITEELVRLLINPENRDILSSLRLELLARANGTAKLQESTRAGVFSFSFPNLNLNPTQWLDLFEKKEEKETFVLCHHKKQLFSKAMMLLSNQYHFNPLR